MRWTAADLPSFAGRTVVVTGANSGLGAITARELARVGARVVLAVRNTDKGEAAARQMTGQVEVRQLDLQDLASVRNFADTVDNVDVLINNAGIMATPEARTVDGFESQIGTNHLGHFALTNLLLPVLTDRVVTVSSVFHRIGRISLTDLNWQSRQYSRWLAYGQSKLANLLFTRELQRRLDSVGSPLRALAAHPGYSHTNLQGHSGQRVEDALMAIGNRFFATDPNSVPARSSMPRRRICRAIRSSGRGSAWSAAPSLSAAAGERAKTAPPSRSGSCLSSSPA
ncbi:short chain dehydrogenase family protein [Mycobacterium xenopi 4042]|uniref:Short chain dehydrogenase family protein n=1 Tax=Mycobacterium xenopi 4042 TaxID=1299334 RepID=X8AFK7_MYCXE|nr:short chain dehydrogenase family protein [Mycobacterium xenopi 4042]